MDVFTLLKQDHKEAKQLFEKIEQSSSRAMKLREKSMQQLAQELEMHTSVEEEIVYPRLKEIDSLKDTILEAYEEHHVATQLLQEITELSPQDEQWMAKVTVLKEMVEHHVREEEKDLFPKAQKALGKEEAAELGKRVEEEKKRRQRSSRGTPKVALGQLRL